MKYPSPTTYTRTHTHTSLILFPSQALHQCLWPHTWEILKHLVCYRARSNTATQSDFTQYFARVGFSKSATGWWLLWKHVQTFMPCAEGRGAESTNIFHWVKYWLLLKWKLCIWRGKILRQYLKQQQTSYFLYQNSVFSQSTYLVVK